MKTGDNHEHKPIRLLLVDDEDDFRQTMAKRLARRGLECDQAANGNECLSMLEKKGIDVVVLDVKMPGMSGIEVLQNITDTYPRTEVILLTGHATTFDGIEGIKSGAFDYLMKPIELGLFVTRGIIEKLGGTIVVESKVGLGTGFSIRLPKHLKKTDDVGEKDDQNWVEKIKSRFAE